MSEQLLHCCKLGSVVQHIGGKGVPQHVGRAARGAHGCFSEGIVHHPVHKLSVKRLSARTDEERVGRRRCSYGMLSLRVR